MEKNGMDWIWIGFEFDLDLIWIEIGVLKNFKECARSPCNGNHFSSYSPLLGQHDPLLTTIQSLHPLLIKAIACFLRI